MGDFCWAAESGPAPIDQGLQWVVDSLKEDEDGDLAHEFIDGTSVVVSPLRQDSITPDNIPNSPSVVDESKCELGEDGEVQNVDILAEFNVIVQNLVISDTLFSEIKQTLSGINERLLGMECMSSFEISILDDEMQDLDTACAKVYPALEVLRSRMEAVVFTRDVKAVLVRTLDGCFAIITDLGLSRDIVRTHLAERSIGVYPAILSLQKSTRRYLVRESAVSGAFWVKTVDKKLLKRRYDTQAAKCNKSPSNAKQAAKRKQSPSNASQAAKRKQSPSNASQAAKRDEA